MYWSLFNRVMILALIPAFSANSAFVIFMDGWSFACQGLGEVGWAMVKEICTKVKNPHLIVADVKQDVVDRCVNEWSAQGIDIKAGRIEDILFEDVDVVVPWSGDRRRAGKPTPGWWGSQCSASR